MVIRAVIFDLDGVLRRWPASQTRSIELQAGIPVGSIARTAFAPRLLRRAVTGVVSDPTWREAVARRLEAAHGSRGREAVSAWSRLRGEINPETLRLLSDVRRVARVALLTNATSRLGVDLAALGLDEAFDVVVNSSAIRVAKPDPVAFVRAAESLGADPAECVVIDDDANAVAVARSLGMTVIRHRGPRTTRRRLVALGVIAGELGGAGTRAARARPSPRRATRSRRARDSRGSSGDAMASDASTSTANSPS